jgi:hypothetical protein
LPRCSGGLPIDSEGKFRAKHREVHTEYAALGTDRAQNQWHLAAELRQGSKERISWQTAGR